ncbi:kynureninase [Loktanella sp. DSM 29012]|uniref:kynureninase n=1 Tax=Loktanella sp. DSM 29012 TaxID=1881056 RepID=UPI0008D0B708|nr:kynureninase [Loktanella sp. DSM 29012]SEQ28968.1 kynureninase [Loktanella sp. DSM 29012]
MTDFAKTKDLFHLPEGMIYLDGNSLGPLPKATPARVARTLTDEWGEMVITGWNRAGWMAQPMDLGDRIGRLIGAEEGHVTVGDTLSVKVFQALAAALAMTDRKVILSDSGNFPSDLYMAEGLIAALGGGLELRVVDPEDVANALSEEVAVLMLTQVDYRTGRLHDMARLTAQARTLGIVTIWDLAHSAGAMDVDVAGCGADFAVGCTYKYLNGGPGAPAFIYVAPRHAETARPILAGWLGHAAPFAFEQGYRPGDGVARMRVGTPPVIQMAALEASMDIWDTIDMADIRAASMALCDRFIAGVEAACPDLTLASPRDAARRGSQVSFRHPQGYAAMQACIAHGVVGDFRAPDIMRFGFTPLFIDAGDVDAAVDVIAQVMTDRLWDDPQFHAKAAVT